MKNKILTLASIVLFSSFGLVGSCDAATIFTDDFNGYVDGGINNQGGWYGHPYVSIEGYDVFEGAKAVQIYNPFPGFFGIEKKGNMTGDGRITMYVSARTGGTTHPEFNIQLKEGDTPMLFLRAPTILNASYYDGETGSYSYLNESIGARLWSTVQIEWRSSDHKARYKINDSNFSDWHKGLADWSAGLDTVNIELTDGMGFVDAMQEGVFAPSKTPVLIVPGLLGTEIKDGSDLLWADLDKMFFSVNDNFMDSLSFNDNLSPLKSGLISSGVLKKLEGAIGLVNFDYSEGLISEFKNQGYIENETLFTFPYDWRYGVTGKFADGKTNADLLAQKIQDIVDQTGSDKVDVVVHSLGGLIVKKYVADNAVASHIGKVVFVGVPNTGAPKAVKVLLEGDNFGIPWLSQEEMKKIGANMPVSYDLLPSQKYYDLKGSFVTVIDQGEFLNPFDTTKKDLNYQESVNFLTGDHGLNSQALTSASNLHSAGFDDFDIRTAGINLYAIDGCKQATIGTVIEERQKGLFGQAGVQYKSPQFIPGDGTVPLESSTNLPVNSANKFYSLVGNHSRMLSQDGVRQEIVNIISGSSLAVAPAAITQDIGKCNLNGKAISVFSPVDIFVTDQNGNKLGLAADKSIINEIPNAGFEVMGDHKFLYLPTDEGQTYQVSMQGTGTGSYTIKSENISNNQSAGTQVFSNLPVTTALTGQINLAQSGGTDTLTVKQTATSAPQTIAPSSIISPAQSQDLVAPNSTSTILGTSGQPGFYRSDVKITLNATDDMAGVLALNYNIDGAGYQKIPSSQAVLTVKKEGSHTVAFFATDKAGNKELEKNLQFTIDKTAPEAIIEFDPSIKDLKFTGQDAYPVTIADDDDSVILKDQAGNTTQIDLKDKDRKKKMSAEIKSLRYNGDKADISKNLMAYVWHTNKNKEVTDLSQHVRSRKDYNIFADFDGKKTVLSGKDAKEKISQSVTGLKIIKIATDKGDFDWSY